MNNDEPLNITDLVIHQRVVIRSTLGIRLEARTSPGQQIVMTQMEGESYCRSYVARVLIVISQILHVWNIYQHLP